MQDFALLSVQGLEPVAQHFAPLVFNGNEDDAAAQPSLPGLPSPTVMDLGDEPSVQLWEGEAYEHIFVNGARVYPAYPPASPRTDARRRLMTSIAASLRARRQAVDMDASVPRFGSATRGPVFSMSACASGSSIAAVVAVDGAQDDTSASFGFQVVDVNSTAPSLPSPTPATPPPSPRTGARRRLVALGVPLASPPSSSRGRHAGAWSLAALGLANGVAPGTRLPGGSSDEVVHGVSSSGRR